MTKIKIFESEGKETLENAVNNFLERNQLNLDDVTINQTYIPKSNKYIINMIYDDTNEKLINKVYHEIVQNSKKGVGINIKDLEDNLELDYSFNTNHCIELNLLIIN